MNYELHRAIHNSAESTRRILVEQRNNAPEPNLNRQYQPTNNATCSGMMVPAYTHGEFGLRFRPILVRME